MVDAGTLQVFYQTAAPTGWTKGTSHDNKALRLVSGTASSGGTNTFTGTFTNRSVNNFSLSSGTMPVHNHLFAWGVGGSPQTKAAGSNSPDSFQNANVGGAGSGGGHSHGIDFSVRYVDVIIASKD
ncbi:MAG TPA: hypothetical protein DCX27_07590 [Balneola sp.]|nr:hypothetical protein [Balneola sp.]